MAYLHTKHFRQNSYCTLMTLVLSMIRKKIFYILSIHSKNIIIYKSHTIPYAKFHDTTDKSSEHSSNQLSHYHARRSNKPEPPSSQLKQNTTNRCIKKVISHTMHYNDDTKLPIINLVFEDEIIHVTDLTSKQPNIFVDHDSTSGLQTYNDILIPLSNPTDSIKNWAYN